MKEKVVLAYSGGLDTSVILKWLVLKGFEVITYTANIGQIGENFEEIRKKAINTGASKVYIEDIREEFVKEYIFPVFATGTSYENRYLLGTSIARPLIAKKMIEIVKKENATYISHGCTGKGNDQVRFELSAYSLKQDIKIIAPWREKEFLETFKGRKELLEFAEKNNIEVKAKKGKNFSVDSNLLNVSSESGVLEDPSKEYPEDLCEWVVAPEKAPDKVVKLKLSFQQGVLSKVENLNENRIETQDLAMFEYLNEIGAKNGVGILDMVENRYVGIKSRGVYETPGGTILHNAVKDLFGITMDKEVFKINLQNAIKLAELVYYGYWFSPETKVVMTTAKECLKNVNGEVVMKIYKGNATPISRTSDNSLYNEKIVSMDLQENFNQEDSTGFIKINATRLKMAKNQ